MSTPITYKEAMGKPVTNCMERTQFLSSFDTYVLVCKLNKVVGVK